MMLSVSFAQVGCWATIFFSISKPASASVGGLPAAIAPIGMM